MAIGIRVGVLILSLVGSWSPAWSESWQGNLKGGGVVQVDPLTHKPTVHYRGGATQLWDGVHELDDGSVLIVRDGVAVPDESMLHTWDSGSPRLAMESDSACERLVRKVCGLADECGGERPCILARQLEGMVRDEASQVPDGQGPASRMECRKGLTDDVLFPICPKDSANTPCKRLVDKVCGANGRCATAEACDLARQLQDMEREERLGSGSTGGATEIGAQCREAAENPYFVSCGGQ